MSSTLRADSGCYAHHLDDCAEVAERVSNGFAGTRHQTAARLLVRRVRPRPGNPLPLDVVFADNAFLTDRHGRCSSSQPTTAGTHRGRTRREFQAGRLRHTTIPSLSPTTTGYAFTYRSGELRAKVRAFLCAGAVYSAPNVRPGPAATQVP